MKQLRQHTIDLSNAEQLLEHFNLCETQFIPPLSSRVDLITYIEKLVLNATRFEIWHDDKLIALLAIYINDPRLQTAYITSVSVVPLFQNMGLGADLLVSTIEYVKALGFQRIELEVHGANSVAALLYKRVGFISISQDRGVEKMRLVLKEVSGKLS